MYVVLVFTVHQPAGSEQSIVINVYVCLSDCPRAFDLYHIFGACGLVFFSLALQYVMWFRFVDGVIFHVLYVTDNGQTKVFFS